MNKNYIILGIAILVIVLGGFGYSIYTKNHTPTPQGSGAVAIPSDGLTADQHPKDVAVAHPIALSTKYITSDNWPPKVQASTLPFACVATGKAETTTGTTEEKTINNQIYCVTTRSDGAAGSTYTTYTYITTQADHTVTTTFTLRYSQCGNYEVAEKKACEDERAAFDIDNIIDEIINSLTL